MREQLHEESALFRLRAGAVECDERGPRVAGVSLLDKEPSATGREGWRVPSLAGVAREIKGIGTGYNHIEEMENSVEALNKSIDSLEGSLRNRNLGMFVRATLQNSLSRARSTLEAMRSALGLK